MLTKVYGMPDEPSLEQIKTCLQAEETAIGALMADHHKGYSMPIGGVVAYREHISPSGVGFDIGCGNLYAETPLDAKDVDIRRVMEEIRAVISFGMGRANNERINEHPVYDSIETLREVLGGNATNSLLAKARSQLGTVGSGNHYVDIFENRQTGKLGVGVHFGSRGLGHTIASGYMAVAAGLPYGERFKEGGMDAPPLLLRLDKPSGQDYERAMDIALMFAYAGRDWVVDRIVNGILGTKREWSVHNNHNYAAREIHHGTEYLVHRKGATPAFPGERGFVGATMGEDALIVEGVDTPEARDLALYSTVHGAGRAMSRTKAAGKTRTKKAWVCRDYRKCDYQGAAGGFRRGPNGETPKCPNCGHKLELRDIVTQLTPGLIDFKQVRADMEAKGIYLVGGGADEAPGAYKRLDEVIGFHKDAIKVLYQLRPLGVAMAGPDTFDPYKD